MAETEDDRTQHVTETILGHTPVEPGWFAVYDDPEIDHGIVVIPICALVRTEIRHPDGQCDIQLRHYVALATGRICDALTIDGFLCVVAPGQDLAATVAAIQTEQQLM